MGVYGLPQISNLVSEFSDARIMSGAAPRMSQRDSRFRPPPPRRVTDGSGDQLPECLAEYVGWRIR